MVAIENNKYNIFYWIIFIIIPIIIHFVYIYFFKIRQYDAIIGIDFGSTFSGYSIIFNSEKDLNIFENNKVISSEFIMYEFKKKGLIIGKEAHDSILFDKNILLDKLYFKIFKRNLSPQNNFTNYVEAASPENKAIEIKYVIREFLRLIKEYIFDNNDKVKKMTRERILWIIAVPPLWDIRGKNLMLEAAKEAEMINCQIILEPEASSLSIFQDSNIDKNLIQNDKTFLYNRF